MHHTIYKIKAKPAASQTRAKVCSLNISMSNENQTGEKLLAIVKWVNENFDHCIINVSDSLQRHNLLSQGFTKEVAYQKAIYLGNVWLAENDKALKTIKTPHEIRRWDEWLVLKQVQDLQKNLHKMYKELMPFQICVDADAKHWVERQLGTNDNPTILKNGINFLIEEFAVHSYMARREFQKGNGKMAQAYPARQLQAEEFLRNRYGRIGLEKSFFVRQKVETRIANQV